MRLIASRSKRLFYCSFGFCVWKTSLILQATFNVAQQLFCDVRYALINKGILFVA